MTTIKTTKYPQSHVYIEETYSETNLKSNMGTLHHNFDIATLGNV